MKKAINLYKKVGESPLQAINIFRNKNPFYKNKKMSYAGRLDPMAEGVLLILIGDETKKINQYLGFDKEYRAEILIGISTDSHDVLGIAEIGNKELINEEKKDKEKVQPAREDKQIIDKNYQNQNYELLETNNKNNEEKKELIKKIKRKIRGLKGVYHQKIPEFSSYKIKRKPMFYYARLGKEIEEVKKTVKIKKIMINKVYEINSKKLLSYVLKKIDLVKEDFRQEEIKKKWTGLIENSDEKFLVFGITVNCSSGTYIRAIADDLGKEFGGGLLLSLKRTKVGKFDVENSLRI